MKKMLSFLILCASTAAFAQETNVSVGMDGSLSPLGPSTQVHLQAEKEEKFNIHGALGRQGQDVTQTIGFVEAEIKVSDYFGKVKVLFDYSPIHLSSTSIATTTEALLKIKLGAQYKGTSIRFSYSPLANFSDRNDQISSSAAYLGAELEQKIGDKIAILGLLKFSDIDKSGKYIRQTAQMNYKVLDGLTVYAYYDNENFTYSKPDASVSNEGRSIATKASNGSAGIGLKFQIKNISSRQ